MFGDIFVCRFRVYVITVANAYNVENINEKYPGRGGRGRSQKDISRGGRGLEIFNKCKT